MYDYYSNDETESVKEEQKSSMENQPKDDDKLKQLATKKGINLNEDDNNENMVTGKSVALKESLDE